jgi:hypothetical protein
MQAIHAFDPCVLENVDGASWKCLSGVRVNRQIIQLVPNMKVYNNLIMFIHILLSFFICTLRLFYLRPNVVSYCITLFLICIWLYSSVWYCLVCFCISVWVDSVILYLYSFLKPPCFLLLLDSAILFMSSSNLSCYHVSGSNFFLYGVNQCRSFNICCGVLNYGQEKEDFIAM